MSGWNPNKSYTMQPNDKIKFTMMNYFRSMDSQANYENVPKQGDRQYFNGHQTNQHHHRHPYHHRQISSNTRHGQSHHFHSRSQSQHHYNTMSQHQPDYINSYYNLPHPIIGQNNPLRPSPAPAQNITVQQVKKRPQMDSMTVMRLGAELGVTIDAAPEMPPSRNYSVAKTLDGFMYKIPFPQVRVMAKDVVDRDEKIYIRKGEEVVVLGPSREDRSKFTICYNDRGIEIPHQYTQQPHIPWIATASPFHAHMDG